MSGESPPTIPGRFPGLNTKKYPGTPKSPLLNTNTTGGGNRNFQARARLLSSKISAPRPINTPSLRREHAGSSNSNGGGANGGTDMSGSSPTTTATTTINHGWGSSSSPFTSPKQHIEIKAEEERIASDEKIKAEERSLESNHGQRSSPLPSSSPSQEIPPHSTTRAWAAPTVQHVKPTASNEFPTSSEAGKSNEKEQEELDEDDKDYLKFIMSDPNHKSWDEMVAEDFDDDFEESMEFNESNKQNENTDTVAPSERFTEDYDRSYPPQLKQTRDNDNNSSNYKTFRKNDNDNAYRYNNGNNTSFDNRRYSSSENTTTTTTTTERRQSNERWNNGTHRRDSTENHQKPTGTWQRRPSYDRKVPYQPTLLQRNRRLSEQSARSDHSREEQQLDHQQHNPLQIITEPDSGIVDQGEKKETNESPAVTEITVVQREVMLTAAERAKKRRDEQEAEYEATRERAKQKAAAMAVQAEEEAAATAAAVVAAKKLNKPEVVVLVEEKKPTLIVTKIQQHTDDDDDITSDHHTQQQQQKQQETTASSPTSLVGNVSKPWNLVAAKKDVPERTKPSTDTSSHGEVDKKEGVAKEEEEEEEESGRPKLSNSNTTTTSKTTTSLTEDEQIWEKHVTQIRRDSLDTKQSTHTITANDWTQYADRLQDKSSTTNKIEKQAVEVEVIDFHQNKGWGEIPSNITRGRGRRNEGWTIADEESFSKSHYTSGRGRSRKVSGSSQRRNDDAWRHSTTVKEEPIVLEILKHTPEEVCPKQKCVSKISNLLHESTSPIFPLSIERLVGKKPVNISFMIDTEESDEEITMINVPKSVTVHENQINKEETVKEEEQQQQTDMNEIEHIDTTKVTNDLTDSAHSTLSYEKKRSHLPTLIYQFPTNTEDTNRSFYEGNQQRPVGVYLSPPVHYVPGNQYMVPYPQAGGNVQHICFPTVSWQPNQRYHVQRYDRRLNYRPSNTRYNEEEWKHPSTTDYSGRGSYRKRGQWTPSSRGGGRGGHSTYKRPHHSGFEHASTTTIRTTTTAQEP